MSPPTSKNYLATKTPVPKSAQEQQRQELSEAIRKLEGKLKQFEALIKKREVDETPKNPKLEAKKNSKEKKDKPSPPEQKKDKKVLKHQQSSEKKPSLDELKILATRVRGQLAIAKQKLAAL